MNYVKNTFLVIKDQMPVSRFYRNFFVTKNAWGLLSRNSHVSSVSGKEKIKYNRKTTAVGAAEQMKIKTGNHFAPYKCLFCEGYHIGKTRK
jgi:hypothetical protein